MSARESEFLHWAVLFGVFFISLGISDRPSYLSIGKLALANAARLAEDL